MAICDCVREVEVDQPRNIIASVASGFLVTLGWWIVIDAACQYSQEELPHPYYAIGVITTLAFMFMNLIPNPNQLDDFTTGCCSRKCAYGWFFFAFIVTFICIIASGWTLFGVYVGAGKTPVWPGVAIFSQNLLIAIASFLYRFGRKEDDF